MIGRFAAVALLAAAACTSSGGSGSSSVGSGSSVTASPDTTTSAEPRPEARAVTSSDGQLSIWLPGPVADLDPRIHVVQPADWPPPLDSAEVNPGVRVYEVRSASGRWPSPLRITRRLDVANFDQVPASTAVPLVTMISYRDGRYRLLDDLVAVRAGGALWVSGTTRDPGLILVSDENMAFDFSPPLPTIVFTSVMAAGDPGPALVDLVRPVPVELEGVGLITVPVLAPEAVGTLAERAPPSLVSPLEAIAAVADRSGDSLTAVGQDGPDRVPLHLVAAGVSGVFNVDGSTSTASLLTYDVSATDEEPVPAAFEITFLSVLWQPG